MNDFLTKCARSTPGTATQIDYPTFTAAEKSDLKLLQDKAGPTVTLLLKRQAMLQALHDRGLTPNVLAYCGTEGPRYLASYGGLYVRSSHSGRPIDAQLPQGPYTPPAALPPAAALATIRGQANFDWLTDSTTDHTTEPDPGSGLPHDPNRVASYLEFSVPTIRSNGQKLLDGGRLVYDPFNHRIFLSEHYRAEYEIINLPAVNANRVYVQISQEIADQVAAALPGTPVWPPFFDDLVKRMGESHF
ncbi:hypothetical protein [Streptomyces sioyaensis]|uniref:hypothetical protein n=1 Tax=Streptomyces sioyaensis TaxID=67364 RepID=UPI0037973044